MADSRFGIAVVLLGLTAAGCVTIGSEPAPIPPLDPVKMEAYMRRNFSHVPNITEAMSRVIQAANGGHPPGVSYTQTATGIQGSVVIDIKGDGSDMVQADATITYNNPAAGIGGGAAFAITSLTSPNLTGSAHANLAVSGGGSVIAVNSGSADLQYKDGPQLLISAANLAVTTGASLVSPGVTGAFTILGSADFNAGSKHGTIFFENNGAGGWRIRVVSPDFATFIVP